MEIQPNRYERRAKQQVLGKKSREKYRRPKNAEHSKESSITWNDFEKDFIDNARQGIISHIQDTHITLIENDRLWNATLAANIPSKLKTQLIVGDRVFFTVDEDDTSAIIEARCPRTSILTRFASERHRASANPKEEKMIAANIDTAVIVASLQSPAFHPRFVDRYLVICENGSIAPIVCINKTDLSEVTIPDIQWYRDAGITVIETSATTGKGLGILKDALRGKTSVFVGNSGVGKSSLVNAILGTTLETNTVSNKTGKGKHTTTTSSLHHWDDNSYLIDTPGIRSLGVFHIDKGQLQRGFPEFASFVDECQYTDCAHSHEPLCGVKKAVEQKMIEGHRYESYVRMLEE